MSSLSLQKDFFLSQILKLPGIFPQFHLGNIYVWIENIADAFITLSPIYRDIYVYIMQNCFPHKIYKIISLVKSSLFTEHEVNWVICLLLHKSCYISGAGKSIHRGVHNVASHTYHLASLSVYDQAYHGTHMCIEKLWCTVYCIIITCMSDKLKSRMGYKPTDWVKMIWGVRYSIFNLVTVNTSLQLKYAICCFIC